MKRVGTKLEYLFMAAIALAVIVSFTLMAFVIEQPCNGIDIDSVWCAMHPMRWNDIVGAVFGYIAALWFTGLGILVGFEFYSPEGSTSGNIVALCLFVPAIILIVL